MRRMRYRAVLICGILCLIVVVPAFGEDCPEPVGLWPLGGQVNTVAVSGDYAFVGSGAVLMVVDVVDPAAPSVVGHIDLPSVVRDVVVSGDFVYLTDGDLHVVDVSDPSSPARVGSLQIAGNASHIAVSGNHVFLAGSGLRVVDIVDPTLPIEVGYQPGNFQNITVVDDYAYAPAPSGLWVLDVGDPTSPTTSVFLAIDGEGADIAVDGDWGYLAEYGGLRILDLSQPDAPVSIAFWEVPRGYGQIVAVLASESLVYVLDHRMGVLILDVEIPIQPIPVGASGSLGAFGDIAITRDRLYLTEDDGLRIVDADPPGAIELGSVEFSGIAAGVVTAGNTAYVASTYMGLRIVDVSDPENPAVLRRIETPGEVHDVLIAGDFAYVADGEAGLRVFDVGNPTSPVEVGAIETPGRALRVALSGDHALVAAESAGLRVIDVSVPESPVEVGSYQTLGDALDVEVFAGDALVVDSWGEGTELRRISLSTPSSPYRKWDIGRFWHLRARAVTVADGLAYVASNSKYGAGSAGLVILDPEEADYRAIRGSCGFLGTAYGVFVSGDTAYVAAGPRGLQTVDVSDVQSPEPMAIPASTVGIAMGVLVSGSTAHVAAHNAGLRIFDVTQTAPVEIGSFDTPGWSRGIAAADGFAFLAASAGLQTYDLADPLSPALLESMESYGGGRVVVADDLAVVTEWDRLSFFDISEPALPVLQGVFQRDSWWTLGVSISDSWAYVAGLDESFEFGGLVVVDISDPATPLEAGMLETPGFVAGIAVRGTTAYAAGGTYDVLLGEWIPELRVIDVEDPHAPTEAGYLQLTQQNLTLEMDMVVAEPYAFVVDEDLWVVDVGDPTELVEIGFLPGVSGRLELVGKYLLVGGESGVQVVDVSDPTSPVEVGRGEAPERINDMALHGIYLHAACGASGVQIFDLSDCPGYTAPPPAPRRGGGRVVP